MGGATNRLFSRKEGKKIFIPSYKVNNLAYPQKKSDLYLWFLGSYLCYACQECLCLGQRPTTQDLRVELAMFDSLTLRWAMQKYQPCSLV